MERKLTRAIELLDCADKQLLLGYAESTAPTSTVELALSRLRDRVADASLHVEAARVLIAELQAAEPVLHLEVTP